MPPGGAFRPRALSPGGGRGTTRKRWRPRPGRQREAAAAPRPPPGGGCASSPGTCGARRGPRAGERSLRAPVRRRAAPPGRPPAPSRRSGGCGPGGLPERGAAGAGRARGGPRSDSALLPPGDGRGPAGPGEAPRGLCGRSGAAAGREGAAGSRVRQSPVAGDMPKPFTAVGSGGNRKKEVFSLLPGSVVSRMVLKWKVVHGHLSHIFRCDGEVFVL